MPAGEAPSISAKSKARPGILIIRQLLLAALLTPWFVQHAAAQDIQFRQAKELHLIPSYCPAPCVDYELSAELQNDWVFAADPSSLTSNNLYPTLEGVVTVAPVDHLRLVGDLIYEPVLDVAPGQSEAFTDLGLYADQLYAQFEAGPVNLQAGKIHPPFGRAWFATPGVHGDDIPGNYELEERIGVDAAYTFEAFGLDQILQAAAFTTDRSVLSDSAFTGRPRTRLSDGGAGNTSGVSSFALTLDGCLGAFDVDCTSDGDFGYQIAGLYQKAGRGGVDEEGDPIESFNEHGYAASINKSIAFGRKTLRLFGEAAYFRRFEGDGDDALFLTASGELEIEPLSYSLVYTSQDNLGANTREQLVEVAAFYDFGKQLSLAGERWSIGVGYSFDHNDDLNTDTHLLGLLLTIDFNGSFP